MCGYFVGRGGIKAITELAAVCSAALGRSFLPLGIERCQKKLKMFSEKLIKEQPLKSVKVFWLLTTVQYCFLESVSHFVQITDNHAG